MAAELEYKLHGIVQWGNRWLVKFNDTKTKLLSVNHHMDPSLIHVKMNGIELAENTSFQLAISGNKVRRVLYIYL